MQTKYAVHIRNAPCVMPKGFGLVVDDRETLELCVVIFELKISFSRQNRLYNHTDMIACAFIQQLQHKGYVQLMRCEH